MEEQMKWSTEHKIIGGFGLAFAVVLLISFIAYENSREFIASSRLVVHTYEVLAELEATLSTLKDAETGQRGYIITGEDSYLEPYNNALHHIHAQLNHVGEQTVDNQRQQDRLGTLEPLIT